jgi:PAS domain S-box-containing protein
MPKLLLLAGLLLLCITPPLRAADRNSNLPPRSNLLMPEEPGQKWTALWIGAALVGILGAVVVWNRSLASKVRTHTAALRDELARRIEIDKALEASEETFSRAFRSSPDAIFLTRVSDGRVIDANENAARIFACSQEKLIGHRAVGEGWGYVSAQDRDRVVALVREQGGRLRDHVLQMLRLNGEQFTALISCETIEVGGEKCFLGVLRDVTEQRRAQEALQKSESALAALMDALPMPAMLLEKDGTFAAANEALGLIFRRRRQELIGQNAYTMLPPDLAASRRAAIDGVFTSGQGIRFEDSNRGRHYINYLSPAPDASGAVTRVAAFALDITERQRTEQALRTSEARLHAIVHHTPNVAVQGYNIEGRVRLWNDASTHMFGFDEATAMDKTLDQLIHTREEAEKFVELLRGLAGSGKSVGPSEYHFHRRNGEEGWCLSTIFEIPGQGSESLFVCMDVDITARKQAEAALQESEERLRLALDAAHMGIFDWDMSSQRIIWSPSHEELWGFKPGEFAGTYDAFSQRVHPDDLPGVNAEVARCIAARKPFEHEFRVVWPDGRSHWILGTGQFEFTADGKPRRMRGTAIEITDRKRAEMERQQLLVQLLEAEDEERGRLARELHDTTAQHLAAARMNLTRLSDTATALTPPVPQLLADSLALISQALHEIRTLTYLLHPPLLEELGLAGAARDYAAGFAQRSGLRVSVDTGGFAGRLPPAMELALFRVIQESLGNVHRHSGSDCALIRLERDAEEVRMEIQDNGRGMTEGARAGVGLSGMRERLRQLGGRLEIESDAEGTTVLASLPLEEASEEINA